MIPLALLRRLADGAFHSGSELGEILGVSRTAVWKALGKLESLGLALESVKGKGYRLKEALDLFDADQILDALPESLRARLVLQVEQSIDSTNTQVNARWLSRPASAPPFLALLAEQQTAGRGRRGRTWQSPFARNIYMSLGFELSGGVEALSGLSLVVGVAIVRALQKLGIQGAGLKWPNDVWIDERKVAGVLVELQGEATTAWRVVVGLGVNVSMTAQQGVQIDQPWISLNELQPVSRNHLASLLLQELILVLDEYKGGGFATFIDEWRHYDVLRERAVLVDGGRLQGVAEGIDAAGALLLRLADGRLESLNAGELSVRPKHS